ncbi:DUF421 domain-containing protein [Bacillus sp. MRMR6]|uniref:DUF421 domain-containing protein n=1 Tax=Bacillus sp. MRMR6 TaxID=1928617 RepID=UPI0009534DED|nr:DUF421 domain-containing protein [Bacillus sp. MRMR6]OLS38533.1 DUF421 domain-containing protein [Bacillus sp. MRMR6]
MEFDWIWKAVIIILGGTLLLRFAGRKSISQMTLAQTVIMIGIGSLLVQPVAGKNIWVTLGVGAVLVATLVVLEFAQLKSDTVEKFITGKAKVVIENGVLVEKNMRKMRLTVDQLEMKLRQNNVSKISDVRWATLEPNGMLGYMLMPEAQPVTNKQFEMLQQDIQSIKQLLNPLLSNQNIQQTQQTEEANLFKEVDTKSHPSSPPQHLQ